MEWAPYRELARSISTTIEEITNAGRRSFRPLSESECEQVRDLAWGAECAGVSSCRTAKLTALLLLADDRTPEATLNEARTELVWLQHSRSATHARGYNPSHLAAIQNARSNNPDVLATHQAEREHNRSDAEDDAGRRKALEEASKTPRSLAGARSMPPDRYELAAIRYLVVFGGLATTRDITANHEEGYSRNKIMEALRSLESREFVSRPKGPNSGYQATEIGKSFMRSRQEPAPSTAPS